MLNSKRIDLLGCSWDKHYTSCRVARSIALVCLVAGLCTWAEAANTVYITQSGAGTGLTCGSPKSAAYFNTAGNWSATPTGVQIGPDTTVHVTGTFTGTSGTTMLTFQGSGSSGHPIILLADSCGGTPDFTNPVWGISGAINTNGKNFLTIDGGGTGDAGAIPSTFVANGVIENTANGSALANHTSSKGMLIPSGSTITIQNWYIHNIYVRSGSADDQVAHGLDDTTVNCLYFGSNSAIDTITVTNNTMTNAGWCINEVGGTTATISHNDISGMEHTLIIAPTTAFVFNNHFHDWGIWDSTAVSLPYHHDGWHCFAGSGGQTQNLYYYNNQADGATGANFTASGTGQFNQVLFMEGNGSGTTCMKPGGTAYIFNNVTLLSGAAPGDILDTGNSTTHNSGDIVANNTSISVTGAPNGSPVGINVQSSNSATVKNNALSGWATLFGGTQNATFSAVDFNSYQNSSGGNSWATATILCGGSSCDTSSFTTWKTGKCVGGVANTCDQNGQASLGSSTFFNLPAGCVVGSVGQSCAPQSGSPLIGAGVNLNSVCTGQPNPGLGALCFDKTGSARPSVGAWDAGAISFNAGPAVTIGPTSFNFGSVTVGLSSSTEVFTLQNTGTATLNLSSENLQTGTNFAKVLQINDCATHATQAPGGTCQMGIRFIPVSGGAKTDNIVVVSDAASSPDLVPLSGTGVGASPAVSLSPTSLSFGNQNVGSSSSPQTINLTNTGGATLNITSITFTTGTQFSKTTTCGSTLGASASCGVSVTFTPTGTGSKTDSVIFTTDASTSPDSASVSGTGATPGTSPTKITGPIKITGGVTIK